MYRVMKSSDSSIYYKMLNIIHTVHTSHFATFMLLIHEGYQLQTGHQVQQTLHDTF
jgi:hypothetical protein